MKHISILLSASIFLILAACSGGKYLETSSTGESLYNQGEFEQVLDMSEQVITELESRSKQAPGTIYSLAGSSAFETGEYDKSLTYLLKAQMQEYSDEKKGLSGFIKDNAFVQTMLHLHCQQDCGSIDSSAHPLGQIEV